METEGFESYAEYFNKRLNTRIKYERLKEEILEKPNDYGNELFRIIDNIIIEPESNGFKKSINPGTLLFRARVVKPKDYPKQDRNNGISISTREGKNETKGFDEMNSIESPLRIPGEGRNNTKGMSYLYVAEDELTACTEIKSSPRELISLATFEVVSPIDIIDLSDDVNIKTNSYSNELHMGCLFGMLMSEFTVPKENDDYYMTQILSDYFRKTGIDGIGYRSFRTDKTNYTIFNSHKSKIRFLSSRLVLHYSSIDVFWDFNEDSNIIAKNSYQHDYDKKIANKILINLGKTFSEKAEEK